jgi:hypothetical protein
MQFMLLLKGDPGVPPALRRLTSLPERDYLTLQAARLRAEGTASAAGVRPGRPA